MNTEGIGQPVIGIIGTNSREYLEALFAALNSGNIAATLRSENDNERITSSGATQIITPGKTTGWMTLPAYHRPIHAHYAQLLFTSGTEGKPKGILLSHDNLADTTERLIDVMQIDSSISEYIGVPVHYSFGFGRARVISNVGGRCFLPPSGFSPSEIAELLFSKQINALSAVPTLLRLLLQESELFEICGKNLRWLEIGSQHMSDTEKLAIRTLFPNAVIVQHYGLTEASRSTFLKIHETEGETLASVGRCYGDSEYRIGDDQRIQLRGRHIATAMLVDGRPVSLLDADGWLTTNDLGHSEQGMLHFDGRADDMINCGGVKISPDTVQLQLQAALHTPQAIGVAKIPDAVRGEVILIAYRRDAGIDLTQLRNESEKILNTMGAKLGGVTKYLAVDQLPLTDTGKLQRRKLAETYLQQQPPDTPSSPVTNSEQNSLQLQITAIWEETLNIHPITPQDNFFDIGGDSLSAIRIMMRMERLGIPKEVCQQLLRGCSIAEIIAKSETDTLPSTTAQNARAIDITRGLLVLTVIAGHWTPALIERLPAFVSQFNRWLAPLYSAGTPGFAIIFGVGIGFFHLPRYRNHPDAVIQTTRRNAAILLLGLTGLALLRIAAILSQDLSLSALDIANTFWSVITYYLLAVLSIPLVLHYLKRFEKPIQAALILSLLSYITHILIDDIIQPEPSDNPVIQFGILILTAKYNYFELSAGALAGVSIGIWLRSSNPSNVSSAWPLCLAALLFSLILSQEMGQTQQWLQWPKPLHLWSWLFYLGAVMAAILLCRASVTRKTRSGAISTTTNLLTIVGTLAFPLFIGHEMVIPLRNLLNGVGVPLATPLAMLAFILPAGYVISRLYRLYFAKQCTIPGLPIETDIKI